MMRHLINQAAIAALLTGCAVGPNYDRPDVSATGDRFAPGYESSVVNSGGEPITDWWSLFDDPMLTKLVERAAADNLDIAEAEARVREARALRGIAVGGFFPEVGADAQVVEQELSENGQQLAFAPPGLADNQLTLYSAGFDASWELDLFGKNRRELEAARAGLESTVEQRRDVVLSAVAETARNYAELRGAQREYAITRQNAESQKATRDLVARQARAGVASRLDLVRAESNLARTEAELPRLSADIRAAIYRLGVLTGQDPQALYAELRDPAAIPSFKAPVPIGLRSDVLRRRADVRRAERDLAASTAEIGSAVADLFPSVTIFGSAGYESIDADDLFDASSQFWSFGPQIRIPIFNGGALRARVEVREAQAEQALIRYERAVLTALEETEAGLVRYTEELRTRAKYAEAVDQQREAMGLVRQRYEAGEISFLEVLDTERQLLDLEQQLVRSETVSTTRLVALFKALGGGWEAFEGSQET